MKSYCSDSREREHGSQGPAVEVEMEEVESAGFADGLDMEDWGVGAEVQGGGRQGERELKDDGALLALSLARGMTLDKHLTSLCFTVL